MNSRESILGIVFVVIVGIAFVIVAGWSFSGADGEQAFHEAMQWSRDMQIAKPAVSCANMDSDGDGYVSCTVRDTETGKIYPVECATATSFNRGCRMQKVNVRNQ